MAQRRKAIIAEWEALKPKAIPVLTALQKPEILQQMKQHDKLHNLKLLTETQGFKADVVPLLFQYGKLLYDIANYQNAAEVMFFYKLLSTDVDKCFEAAWGKLASEILCANWETALEDLLRMRDMIDGRSNLTAIQQMELRRWLIHWSV